MLRPDYALDCPVAIAITDCSSFYARDGYQGRDTKAARRALPSSTEQEEVGDETFFVEDYLSGSGLAVSVPPDCVWQR
jgi:hypothetical protein